MPLLPRLRRFLMPYRICGNRVMCLQAIFLCGVLASNESVAQSQPTPRDSPAAAVDAVRFEHPSDLARAIDSYVQRFHRESGIHPAERSSDSEFLRRLYLDLGGQIPEPLVVRRFLSDQSLDKREQAMERLMNQSEFVNHMSRSLTETLLPSADAADNIAFAIPPFEGWMRTKVREHAGWDSIVREILTTPVEANPPSPISFFSAREVVPEKLAAATSRLFLGVRLECAQCHDHPFDHWKRQQFWELAAYFSSLERRRELDGVLGQLQDLFARRSIQIPETTQVVSIRNLDGSVPQTGLGINPRLALADWIVSRDNPYFSRTLANRLWAHLIGRGLVDPVDDFGPHNPASHPELLALLEQAARESDFDLRFLLKGIVLSETYQRTSRETHESQADPAHLARARLKSLSPRQLYASLTVATGIAVRFDDELTFAQTPGSLKRREFLAPFQSGGDPSRQPATVLQALMLLNGDLVNEVAHPVNSRVLAAILELPGLSLRERTDAMFLSTLSRPITEPEWQRLHTKLQSVNNDADRQVLLSDVYWTLLNSSEFRLNH